MSINSELGGRGGTIGGSLVGQIMGVCPYGGPHDAWLRITQGHQIPDNEAMERGRRLEPWIAVIAAEELGLDVVPPVFTTQRFPGEPRLTYSTDFEALDKNGDAVAIVEIKTSNDRRKWPAGGHPEHRLQVEHYLEGRGLDLGYIVGVQASVEVFRFIYSLDDLRYALANDCAKLHIETVKRSPRYGEEVIPFLLDWFETYVSTKTPPRPDASKGCTEALRAHYMGREGEAEVTPDIDRLARQFVETRDKIKELQQLKQLTENELRERLGRHKSAKSDGVRVTISEQAGRVRFDSKRFEAENPEQAAKYMVKGGSFDRFTVRVSGE